jgi:hypothetical protein
VFTARYALSPYIKQIRSVFKGLIIYQTTEANVLEYLSLHGIFYSENLNVRDNLEDVGVDGKVLLRFYRRVV